MNRGLVSRKAALAAVPAAGAIALILALVASGCTNPLSKLEIGGTLQIAIADGVSRTLLPGISMEPDSYLVVGTGANGASFSKTVPGSSASVTVEKLAFGDWSVSVTARNAAGTPIGSGSAPATVHTNRTTTVAITVVPYDGFGSLELSLDWPAADIDVAQVESKLLPFSGEARDLDFMVDGPNGAATSLTGSIPTGYHTLTLKLLDNGTLAMGAVEVVRIVKEVTTSGGFHFDHLHMAGGTLLVNITPELGDPLTVHISGAASTKPSDTSLPLSASIDESGVNATYVWYVDGEQKETGDTYSFDSSWPEGYYNVSVTAFSADGKRAGSTTTSILVVSPGITLEMTNDKLTGGYGQSLALKHDYSVWASGANYSGQLGDGTTADRHTFDQVMVGNGGVEVAAGEAFSLVLARDGTLWGFGQNAYGQLGDGTTEDRHTPLATMTGVVQIAAGSMHSLALKRDGTLWAFGMNYYGQLGTGDTSDRHSPVQIMSDVKAVAAGDMFSLALKNDDSLWTFGSNAQGQLGDGTTTDRSTPTQVLAGVSSMAAGTSHSLAVSAGGTLLAFGMNLYGQLGDGTNANRLTPTPVMGGVRAVAAGSLHSLVITTDARLLSFGWNNFGQLGTGDRVNRNAPYEVTTGIDSVGAGYYFSLALTTDGRLLAFGRNDYGQLGDGTTTDHYTPFEVAGFSY